MITKTLTAAMLGLSLTSASASAKEIHVTGATAKRLTAVLLASESELQLSSEIGRPGRNDHIVLRLPELLCQSLRFGGPNGVVKNASCSWKNEAQSLALILAVQEAGISDTTGQPSNPAERWLHIVDLKFIECQGDLARNVTCTISTQKEWEK